MRKPVALFYFVLSSSIISFGQQPEFNLQQADTSLDFNRSIVVKGEQIRRFPTSNFMDAVNAMFPWVFAPYSTANDFNFVVDGYMLTDINSISLHDIEEISFSREQLSGNRFPFSKAGTFFIRTRTAGSNRFELNFNTQYDHAWNKKKFLPASAFRISQPPLETFNESDNRPGHFISNHLSLSRRGKKASFFFSAQMNTERSPRIIQYTDFTFFATHDTIRSNTVGKYSDQRLFLNFSYKFSDKISAGITGSYGHSMVKTDTVYSAAYGFGKSDYTIEERAPLNHYRGGAFVNYKPFKRLSNTLWLEYAYDTVTARYREWQVFVNSGSQPSRSTENNTAKPESKRLVIRDELKYELARSRRFMADLSMTFVYTRHDIQRDYVSIHNVNDVFSGASGNWYKMRTKVVTLNPVIQVGIPNILSAYAGTNMLIGKKLYKSFESNDKISFYGGLTGSIAGLTGLKPVFNDLSLSFHYADLLQNNSNDQWMGSVHHAFVNTPQSLLTINLGNAPGRVSFARQQLITARLNISSTKDRFRFIAEWSRLKLEKNYLIRFGPNFVYLVTGLESRKGFAFEVMGKLIDKRAIKWQVHINALFPETKADPRYSGATTNPDKSAMRAGLQNRIETGNLFFQLNMFADINRHYYVPNTFPERTEKHNDFSVNYLLAGYHIALKSKATIKGLSVFAHSRNPFVSKKIKEMYDFNPYAGAGVNLIF